MGLTWEEVMRKWRSWQCEESRDRGYNYALTQELKADYYEALTQWQKEQTDELEAIQRGGSSQQGQ